MDKLKMTVRVLCIIPFLTGVADIFYGEGLLNVAGARLENAANDPVLNSQIGFWGAIWLGFGFILWRASSHLRDEADLFRLLCGTLVVSGLARFASMMMYGFPGPILMFAMAVELGAGTGLLLWHTSALKLPNMSRAVSS